MRPILVIRAVAVLLVGLFVCYCLPIAAFPFDIDPSDGDFLGMANRILAGKTLYGDWWKGDMTLPYPPLYFYMLAAGARLGSDAVVFARTFNLAVILASLVLVVCITYSWVSSFQERKASPEVIALMACILALTNPSMLSGLLILRPDALLAMLTVLQVFVLARWPKKTLITAIVAILAVFTKQVGIAVFVSTLAYYLFPGRKGGDRGLWRRFLIVFSALAVALTALFEGLNHGLFLKAVFFAPSQAFSGHFLSWSQVWQNVLPPWGIQLFVVTGFAVFAIHAFRTKILPVALIFLFTLGVSVVASRNMGSDAFYLVPSWFVGCILASVGVGEACLRIAAFLKPGAAKYAYPILFGLVCMSAIAMSLGLLLMKQTTDYEGVAVVIQGSQASISERVKKEPAAKWMAARSATVLTRLGVTLDQEWCAGVIAAFSGGAITAEPIVRRMAAGEYGYILLSPPICRFGSPYDPVLRACFKKVEDVAVSAFAEVTPGAVLQYDGALETCHKLE